MTNKYWLYIDSYVHVNVKKNNLLIYNPLNGSALVEIEKPKLARLVKRLISPKNMLVEKLTSDELTNEDINNFVTRIRNLFMGDLIDAEKFNNKPVSIPSKIKIMKDFKKSGDKAFGSEGSQVKQNLTNLSIYLNNHSSPHSKFPADAYKQFTAPCFKGTKSSRIELEPLKRFFEETQSTQLERINILGGNIFKYPNFDELVNVLNSIPVYKAYYIHYPQLTKNSTVNFEIQGEFDVMVDFPVEEDVLAQCIDILRSANAQIRVQFVVQTPDEIDLADHIITRFKIDDFSYMPYYNGRNLDFFREAVFVGQEEILEARPSQKEILKREIMNPTLFGRLTILSNGDIFANVNRPKLGKLGKDSLSEVVYKEMTQGRSWRKARCRVKPCSGCIFQQLCPPISNYEFSIGKHNLCLI